MTLLDIVAVSSSGLAAIFDFRTRRIPNLLTGIAFLLALLLAEDRILLLLGAISALSLLAFLPKSMEAGGGDIKLAAVLGACLGPLWGIVALALGMGWFFSRSLRIMRPLAPSLFLGTVVTLLVRWRWA